MSTVSSFLDKLTQIKTEDIVAVKLPSLGKDIAFNTINVKQQKNLLKHAIDGANGIAGILKEMNTIIFENAVDKTTEISSVDKYPILISLRKKSLGNNIKIDNKDYTLLDLPTYEKLPKSLLSHTVELLGIKVDLHLPSLLKETEFLSKTISDIKRLTDDKAKETVGIMYTYEIIKFIKTITFSEGSIEFADISTQDKKTIVESLPVELNQQILAFINKVREFENQFITFADNAVVPINTLFLSGE